MKQTNKKFKSETFLVMLFGVDRVIRWQQRKILKTHRKIMKLQEQELANQNKLNFYESYRHITTTGCGFYKIHE